MKNISALFLFIFLSNTALLNGQNTGDENFVIDITIDNQTLTFKKGACGFSAPNDWGGPITGDWCLPVVWGYGAADSLGCDSLIADYSGKIVMLRRGGCEFGQKALYAEKAGAAAAIIANGYTSASGDACNAPGMGSGAVGAQVTIPVFMFCRNMVDLIDNALAAGQQPEICIRRLSLKSPTAEYAYATPVSQADTMDLITCGFINRTGTAQTFTARAVVIDPNGNQTELVASQFVDYPGDTTFYFPSYVPPATLGKFKVVYSVDGITQVGDSLFREFEITEYTFATDNFKINGGEVLESSWPSFIHSTASLIKTGDVAFEANYASFGLHNAAAAAVADPSANVVSVVLYDADGNNDGINDIGMGITPFDAMNFIAFHDFIFDANTPPDAILNVELIPIDGDKVLLKTNHLYYLRLISDPNTAANGISLSFTTTEKVEYGQFEGIGPVTPLVLDNLYAGWEDRTVIARLLRYYSPIVPGVRPVPLDAGKWSLSPNPAATEALVQISLDRPNSSVMVALIDLQGKIVASQTLKNIQTEQLCFDVSHLPSGNYGVWIRASEEGSAMTVLQVGH